ncbi:type II toxin-antitoxin system death-on-curing family toxin (plasmid) [Paenibacillus sp. S-38]|uniref:type II toxin-antitoxin system death-on-curing family toxin n=1 Tax=Paenibacillus sp. S-38 TaxID=3416710 RepID=UPI003CEBAD68
MPTPLTYQDICSMHQLMLDLYGGLSGVYDDGRIHFLAEQPFMESFGQELYPGLFLKAAIYLISIARAHAFVDANKRTAAIACDTFLLKNGYMLRLPGRTYEIVVRQAAQGRLSPERAAILLRRYTKRLS